MPSAPAASSDSRSRSQAARSDVEDVRCHAGIAEHRQGRVEVRGRSGAEMCLRPGVSPRGGEPVVQWSSVCRCPGVGRVDGHQPGFEVEGRGHPVEGLEALARDRVDVAVHVDETGPHHVAGDVDDLGLRVLLPIARERRPDGGDLPAVDHDVSHPFGPRSRVHDQSSAKNQHSFIQLQGVTSLIG